MYKESITRRGRDPTVGAVTGPNAGTADARGAPKHAATRTILSSVGFASPLNLRI